MQTGLMSYNMDEISSDWMNNSKGVFYYSEQNISFVSEIIIEELVAYPNPFSSYVSFNISGYNDKIMLNLFDIQGRKVLSKEIRNHENVNMEGLSKGMYFYNLIISGKKLNGKLIKE